MYSVVHQPSQNLGAVVPSQLHLALAVCLEYLVVQRRLRTNSLGGRELEHSGYDVDEICPVCGSEFEAVNDFLDSLRDVLEKVGKVPFPAE